MLIVFVVEFGWFVDSICFVLKLIERIRIMSKESSSVGPVDFLSNVEEGKTRTGGHEANDWPEVGMAS